MSPHSILRSAILTLLVASTASARADYSAASLLDSLSWAVVDTGVNFATDSHALGNDAFVGLGGWTVKQPWANTWVASLDSAKLRSLGVRYLYSVRGPLQDDYSGREIATMSLARNLVALVKSDTNCRRIIIAAHSSGAYVAHALFQDLYDGASIDSTGVTWGKILYFCLDGGIGAGGSGVPITQQIAERLAHIYGVYAFDPGNAMYSPNKAEMVDLGAMFGPQSSSLEISARGCGCSGAWCVHETLINQHPYNPTTFDLKNDYGNINAAHPVTTTYLEVITGIGELSPGPRHPEQFHLEQNYPNPFNGQTRICFQLSTASGVSLKVFDLLGREAATLIQEKKPAGVWTVPFDAAELPSGVYFFQLLAGSQLATGKMILVR